MNLVVICFLAILTPSLFVANLGLFFLEIFNILKDLSLLLFSLNIRHWLVQFKFWFYSWHSVPACYPRDSLTLNNLSCMLWEVLTSNSTSWDAMPAPDTGSVQHHYNASFPFLSDTSSPTIDMTGTLYFNFQPLTWLILIESIYLEASSICSTF